MKPVDQPAITQDSGAADPALLQSHLPSLDGMRAISILLVLAAHGTWAADRKNHLTLIWASWESLSSS